MRKIFKFKKIYVFLYNILVILIPFFLIELIFKCVSHQYLIDVSILRILLSSIIISSILAFLELFLKPKNRKTINLIFMLVITIYSFVQVGFHNFIGVYISINVSSQAKAVASYIFDFFKSFYWYYYLLFIPIILLFTYYKLIERKILKISIDNNFNKTKALLQLICILLIGGFGYNLSINLDVFQNKLQTISNKDLFTNPSNPSIAIKQFGISLYGILDVKNIFIKSDTIVVESNYSYSHDTSNKILDTDWLELIEKEENPVLNNLNEYFINNKINEKNSYTGLFEDKNLIVILMESVNDIFINPELYPNFYKLVSNGYYFENNYSPRNSCATGNNELSGMIGLYSIYDKCTANTYSTNLYPESMFNLFNNKGYKTTSMHDYTERYYARREIHTNMGSKKYYDVDDLKIAHNTKDEEWASDEDFMKEVVKILNGYKEDERFMTWLTTVTSHQPYGSSVYGDKYLYLLNDSKYANYDIKLKRYMSKLKVLDDGLGVLLEGLKSQNKLDDTVIVLYGDHYPYGLSNNILKEALPYSIEEKYEAERVPFVIWSSDTEGTKFSQYTSYVNILPTIANLFNLDYDSRYYVGDDLFSNTYQSMTIFADSSWKNEIAFYDASTSDITYYGKGTYSIDDLIKINEMVENKIKYSNLAIQHDYFNYLYQNLK
ncbi:MAG: sulfatase-like hydrolase/transferase [Bacilli bacterium]|nr:sulfatase-like hydrolase/transferase [Bacilli bacterium]